MFRNFMDNIIRFEDAKIFPEVACLGTLQDTDMACMEDPMEEYPEEDMVAIATLSKEDKIRRLAQKNTEVRASTSAESRKSYEEFKAEKHFRTPLNTRHLNKMPFTKLLRQGTGVCCYFQEDPG